MTTETEHKQLSEGLQKLFSQRESFIVIGLTGRTGSGCTTAADLLAKNISGLALPPAKNPLATNDDRKYSIVLEWVKAKWKPFTRIRVGSLIFYFLSRIPETERNSIFNELQIPIATNSALSEFIAETSNKASEFEWVINGSNEGSDDEVCKAYQFFFTELPELLTSFKKILDTYPHGTYTALMQQIGDNIRRSGSASCPNINPEKIFSLPLLINKLIKIARRINKKTSNPDFFVIDAIRNPFEAAYFRERYSSFYLFGITTDEISRHTRLNAQDYTDTEITKLSEKEYPNESNLKNYSFLVSQNIGKCLEVADIIIENKETPLRENYQELSITLVKYISLIQHPGLIPPSHTEQCMQVALTAKLGSGCVSRQVGAAITDESYSIKAIGWNSTPEGQVPCILRNVKRVADHTDKEAFSPFELGDKKFRKAFDNIPQQKPSGHALEGRPLSYCFKSTYNATTKEKNQVHTRALHAEENAFLQLAKYGSSGISGGYLFTTASPCELCAKKAYQLGIKRIYFIDPYPGISEQHILGCGTKKPKVELFTGALGRAYVQLYQPLVSPKDELDVLLKSSQ